MADRAANAMADVNLSPAPGSDVLSTFKTVGGESQMLSEDRAVSSQTGHSRSCTYDTG